MSAVELGIRRDAGGVSVRAYTQLLTHVLAMLEEIDRLATPGRVGRPEWAVRSVSESASTLRMTLLPRTLPRHRDLDSLSVPPQALVSGVEALAEVPEIPRLFSATVVSRVDEVGQQVGRRGVAGVLMASVNGGRTAEVPLTEEVQRNARRAVEPSSISWSSVVGILDVISARRERRQIGLLTDRGAVVCNVQNLSRDLVFRAFERRVVAAGLLKRNARGQAVRLDAESLEILSDKPSASARDLLGAAPNVTGGLSDEEFMGRLRDR